MMVGDVAVLGGSLAMEKAVAEAPGGSTRGLPVTRGLKPEERAIET